jgi:hypothetical protein
MISELRDGSYLYLRSRANDMDALMRRFRWRGALYRWPGVADEPAGHITTTPLVTSLTHPPHEPCAFRPAGSEGHQGAGVSRFRLCADKDSHAVYRTARGRVAVSLCAAS